MSQEKKKNKFLGLIIGGAIVLLLLNAFFLYKWVSTSNEMEEKVTILTNQTEELETDYNSALEDLDGLESDLSEMKGVNDELDALIEMQEAEIAEQRAYISDLKRSNSNNVSKLNQLKASIASFKSQMASDKLKIDSLYSANVVLTEENEVLTEENQSLDYKLTESKVVNESLTVDLIELEAVGKLLSIANVNAQGVKKKGDKDIETSRVSRMDKLRVRFNTGMNKVNKDPRVEVFFRIKGADGSVINGVNPGTTVLSDKSKTNYSEKIDFSYSGKDKRVTAYLPNSFAKGSYTLEVIQDGHIIGGTKFTLK